MDDDDDDDDDDDNNRSYNKILDFDWFWVPICRVIGTRSLSIQLQVSNLNNFKLDTCNWTPTQFARHHAR